MKLWLSALILTHTFLTAPGNAATDDIDRPALREVLETTGVTPQIDMLEELVVDSANRNANRCGAAKPVISIPSFSAESIVFDTLNGLEHTDSTAVNHLLKWFKSTLADKIHIAEQTFIDRESFIQSVPSLKQDQLRLTAVKNIIKNTRTIEFIVTVGTEIEYAGILHSGCINKAEIKTPGKKNYERRLAEATRSDKNVSAQLIEVEVTLELAYLLKGLSIEELQRYEAFTASDKAQAFYSTLISSIEKSFGLASDRINLQEGLSALDF